MKIVRKTYHDHNIYRSYWITEGMVTWLFPEMAVVGLTPLDGERFLQIICSEVLEKGRIFAEGQGEMEWNGTTLRWIYYRNTLLVFYTPTMQASLDRVFHRSL